jgi:CBS domain-containing protein
MNQQKGDWTMKNGKEGAVREIMMGSPVTLKPDDTLDLANDVISLGRIRHIPVVSDGKLVGLLSERDLIGAAATQIFGLKQKSKSALLKSVLIKDVMKKRVITVKPETPIKEAAHLLAEKKIGCVPVVSEGSLVGLVTTTDATLAAHLRLARNHGQTKKYQHTELGWTARLDELQAAILRVKLRHLPAWTLARQALAARYSEGLAGLPIVLPAERPGGTHVFHQYTIRTPQRDALAAHLTAAGIGTACHYPLPIPAQPLFRDLGYDATPFPAAWAAAREVLSLPCFPELRSDEIDAVIAAVRGFFEGDS